jgi:hypothetical protein
MKSRPSPDRSNDVGHVFAYSIIVLAAASRSQYGLRAFRVSGLRRQRNIATIIVVC